MKELVVISGKGGTGKTSIVASFAAISDSAVLADCDVDAADLHLILDPTIEETHNFSGGSRARIISTECIGCGRCEEVCRFDAVALNGDGNDLIEKTYTVDPISCEGCGVCAHFCPTKTIEFEPAINGEWYVSETRFGKLVHARLGIAEENSGKLVSIVRKSANDLAKKQNSDLVLIDGSPGIGCPVIASITGADVALIVTEPTLSGMHDLERVGQLTKHFGITSFVCVNKWDLNSEITEKIETMATEHGIKIAGRVRYDKAVTTAQVQKKSIVEFQKDGCAKDIQAIWDIVNKHLNE